MLQFGIPSVSDIVFFFFFFFFSKVRLKLLLLRNLFIHTFI